jgi:hypothetical protein
MVLAYPTKRRIIWTAMAMNFAMATMGYFSMYAANARIVRLWTAIDTNARSTVVR